MDPPKLKNEATSCINVYVDRKFRLPPKLHTYYLRSILILSFHLILVLYVDSSLDDSRPKFCIHSLSVHPSHMHSIS
jgi:hypothetical protein